LYALTNAYKKQFIDILGLRSEAPQESCEDIVVRVMQNGGLHFAGTQDERI
jgi:hypothetical protein